MKIATKMCVLFSLLLECKGCFFIFKTATVVAKTFYFDSFHPDFRNLPMFWLNSQVELFCQEVILVQPYGYQPFLRQRGNAWSKIADSLNYIDNSKFDVN